MSRPLPPTIEAGSYLSTPSCSYISAPGPYRRIPGLGDKYPNLNRLFNIEPSRAACLELSSNGNTSPKTFTNLTELKGSLSSRDLTSDQTPRRRLYVLEGMNPQYVAAFGEALQVDPNVFLRHKRVALRERDHKTGIILPLASLQDPQQSFMMEYCELLYFSKGIGDFSMRNARNERHVAVTRFSDGRFDNVGTLQAKASFWARKYRNGGWDALIIVDEHPQEFFVGGRNSRESAFLATEPYQGGYADFIGYDTLTDATSTRATDRSSMFGDLCNYWSSHGNNLRINENPLSATVFLQKIIASHYMLLYEYNRGTLSHLQWILSRRETYSDLTVKWVEERWSDIQAFNRRCEDNLRNIQSIIQRLRMRNDTKGGLDWLHTAEDFLALEEMFADLKKKCESLASSYTGLAGIVGNRQSLREARSVRILSLLGMTYLPLSLACGLFSMADNYLPGASRFWIYFAVTIPLIFVTFAVPILISLGYESTNEGSAKSWFRTFWRRVCLQTQSDLTSKMRSRLSNVVTSKRTWGSDEPHESMGVSPTSKV